MERNRYDHRNDDDNVVSKMLPITNKTVIGASDVIMYVYNILLPIFISRVIHNITGTEAQRVRMPAQMTRLALDMSITEKNQWIQVRPKTYTMAVEVPPVNIMIRTLINASVAHAT